MRGGTEKKTCRVGLFPSSCLAAETSNLPLSVQIPFMQITLHWIPPLVLYFGSEALKKKKKLQKNQVYLPRTRQTTSKMTGIPEASNIFAAFGFVSSVKSFLLLSGGETRRSLSAAHVSLFQHTVKTQHRHCLWERPSRCKSTTERLLGKENQIL